jgi:hypothetical protein
MENGHSAQRVTISLFPGLALSSDAAPWTMDVTIRLYGDSAQALAPSDERALTLGPGEVRTMRFTAGAGLRQVPSGYVPLGLLLVRTGDEEIWATEALLSPQSGVGVK